MKNVILYGRVSGREQGRSGLGLAHQLEEMKKFCAANDLNIIAHYEEVVSGKYYLERRPVLSQAVAHSKRASNKKDGDCFILASRLDRLSRENGFICELLKKGVNFATVETGLDCGPLLLQIRSSVAEEERRKASDRSRGACQIKRMKGVPMGMHIPSVRFHKEKTLDACKKAIVEEADSFALFMRKTITRMRNEGMSVNAIAAELNEHEFKTQRGGKWYATTVCNLMARWDKISEK